MTVYIVHANWHIDNEQDIKVFSTKEKALGYIKEALVSHKFTDGVSPILRRNKQMMTVDSVIGIIENWGFYINDWYGENHIHPFTIKLLEQELD